MAKIIYRVDVKGTIDHMEVGDYLLLPYREDIPIEGVRNAASRLRPKIFEVHKSVNGIKVTRTE